MAQHSNRDHIFVVASSGDEARADESVTSKLERMAKEQHDQSNSQSAKDLPREFTVYLLPNNYSPRTSREELLPVNFPFEMPTELAAKMGEDVRALYALEGGTRLVLFEYSIVSASDFYINGRFSDFGMPDFRFFKNATTFKDKDEVVRAARVVVDAFRKADEHLQAQIKNAITLIEAKAKSIAMVRLQDARNEILAEATRYLRYPRQPNIAPKDLLEQDIKQSEVLMKVPGIAPLLGALRRIQERSRPLAVASQAFEEKRTAATDQFWLEGLLTLRNIIGEFSDEEMERLHPGSHDDVDQAASDLALSLSVECRDFPILHRVWSSPILPSEIRVASLRGEATLMAASGPARRAINQLKENIWQALRKAWEANKDITERLQSDASLVWRYPPVIQEALNVLSFDDPSVEFRAAQERMEKEEDMSVAGMLATITGAMEIGAPLWAGPAAPEAMAALAVAGLALGAIDLAAEHLRLGDQGAAFNAVLDPSRSLASEPGYTGFVVGIAFTLLGIKGARDAMRTARFAGELASAEKALEVLKP